MTAVLGGLCAVAVVVLALVVARLSAQVRQLTAELSERAPLAAATGSPAAPPPSPSVEPLVDQRVTAPTSQQRGRDDVPVITALPDADDDLDVTAWRVASVTLARPLIKIASLSYGLRRALDDEHRFKVRYAMRLEFRRQRKMRRRRRAGRAPSMGWRL